MTYNTTPIEDAETDTITETTETHSLANEIVWEIGNRKIKLWEMIIGVILLVTFLPMVFKR
jgi:hypothetical protein